MPMPEAAATQTARFEETPDMNHHLPMSGCQPMRGEANFTGAGGCSTPISSLGLAPVYMENPANVQKPLSDTDIW